MAQQGVSPADQRPKGLIQVFNKRRIQLSAYTVAQQGLAYGQTALDHLPHHTDHPMALELP